MMMKKKCRPSKSNCIENQTEMKRFPRKVRKVQGKVQSIYDFMRDDEAYHQCSSRQKQLKMKESIPQRQVTSESFQSKPMRSYQRKTTRRLKQQSKYDFYFPDFGIPSFGPSSNEEESANRCEEFPPLEDLQISPIYGLEQNSNFLLLDEPVLENLFVPKNKSIQPKSTKKAKNSQSQFFNLCSKKKESENPVKKIHKQRNTAPEKPSEQVSFKFSSQNIQLSTKKNQAEKNPQNFQILENYFKNTISSSKNQSKQKNNDERKTFFRNQNRSNQQGVSIEKKTAVFQNGGEQVNPELIRSEEKLKNIPKGGASQVNQEYICPAEGQKVNFNQFPPEDRFDDIFPVEAPKEKLEFKPSNQDQNNFSFCFNSNLSQNSYFPPQGQNPFSKKTQKVATFSASNPFQSKPFNPFNANPFNSKPSYCSVNLEENQLSNHFNNFQNCNQQQQQPFSYNNSSLFSQNQQERRDPKEVSISLEDESQYIQNSLAFFSSQNQDSNFNQNQAQVGNVYYDSQNMDYEMQEESCHYSQSRYNFMEPMNNNLSNNFNCFGNPDNNNNNYNQNYQNYNSYQNYQENSQNFQCSQNSQSEQFNQYSNSLFSQNSNLFNASHNNQNQNSNQYCFPNSQGSTTYYDNSMQNSSSQMQASQQQNYQYQNQMSYNVFNNSQSSVHPLNTISSNQILNQQNENNIFQNNQPNFIQNINYQEQNQHPPGQQIVSEVNQNNILQNQNNYPQQNNSQVNQFAIVLPSTNLQLSNPSPIMVPVSDYEDIRIAKYTSLFSESVETVINEFNRCRTALQYFHQQKYPPRQEEYDVPEDGQYVEIQEVTQYLKSIIHIIYFYRYCKENYPENEKVKQFCQKMPEKMNSKRIFDVLEDLIYGFRKKDIKCYRNGVRVNELHNLRQGQPEILFRYILELYTLIVFDLKEAAKKQIISAINGDQLIKILNMKQIHDSNPNFQLCLKIITGICYFQDPEEAPEQEDPDSFEDEDLLFSYIMSKQEKRNILWDSFWNQISAPKLDSLKMFCHAGQKLHGFYYDRWQHLSLWKSFICQSYRNLIELIQNNNYPYPNASQEKITEKYVETLITIFPSSKGELICEQLLSILYQAYQNLVIHPYLIVKVIYESSLLKFYIKNIRWVSRDAGDENRRRFIFEGKSWLIETHHWNNIEILVDFLTNIINELLRRISEEKITFPDLKNFEENNQLMNEIKTVINYRKQKLENNEFEGRQIVYQDFDY